MDTKERSNICTFYASEMHLEMILLPYINQKLEKNEKIYLINQENLNESINIVIEKMNLNKKIKKDILNLEWNNRNNEKIEQINNETKNTMVFISGDEDFNKKMNDKIYKRKNIEIINCYNIYDIDNINLIKAKHDKLLSTIGIKEFC